MHPADRAGLHWQPLGAREREALFDRVEALLAARARARQLPLLPDEPVRSAETCPDCGNPTLWQRARPGPGGARWCPNCGWEEAPR